MSEYDESKQKIPLGEKFAFASADAYGGGAMSYISVLYLFFLTNVIGLTPVFAGTVIMIARMWNAIADPLMGTLSDNTRTKWGRRRPYIVLGGLLIIPSFAFLFAPIGHLDLQDGIKIPLIILAALIYYTVSTIFNLPYGSMSAEISTDFNERNKVNSLRLLFSGAFGAVLQLIPMLVTDSFTDKDGKLLYTLKEQQNIIFTVSMIIAAFFFTVIMLSGIISKERVPIPENKSEFSFKNFIKPFEVKSFRNLLLMYVFAFMCSDILMMLIIYIVKYILDSGVDSLYMMIALAGMAFVAFPIVYFNLKRTSKSFMFRIGIPLYIIGGVLLATFPKGWDPYIALIFAGLTGLGYAGPQLMPWLIFPDIVDLGEMKTGTRDTGMFSGMMTFTRKTTSALAVFLVGVVLQAFGWEKITEENPQPDQPDSVILAIRLVIIVTVCVFMIIAFIASYRLKISPEKTIRIRKYLELQRDGKLNELTQDEVKEFTVIGVELIGEDFKVKL